MDRSGTEKHCGESPLISQHSLSPLRLVIQEHLSNLPSVNFTLVGLDAQRYGDVMGRPSEQDEVEIAVPDIDALFVGRGSLAHGDFYFPERHGVLYLVRLRNTGQF